MNVTVLVPIYNDWDSLKQLLRELDRAISRAHRLHLVVVDDGSTEPKPENLVDPDLVAFASATYLRLKCNVGHQRAIATALSWIGSAANQYPVIIMDGDGEDKPSDVPRLLEAFISNEGKVAVFAERTKRSESLLFKQFYALYRLLHWLMIGLSVKIGNFSVLPHGYIEGLTVSNYLWYHYAATVVRTRMDFITIKTARGRRYSGNSKMNFVSLVRHGVSAIAVHAEVLSVRMLIASCIATLLGLAVLAGLIWIRLFTTLATPGWTTTASGVIAVLLLQVLSLAFTFSMQSVSIHGNTGFLPVRDCPVFLRSAERLDFDKHPRFRTADEVVLR